MGGVGDGGAFWPPQDIMGTEREVKATAKKEVSLDIGTQVPLLIATQFWGICSGDGQGK